MTAQRGCGRPEAACTCTFSFTCGYCLSNLKPYHWTHDSGAVTVIPALEVWRYVAPPKPSPCVLNRTPEQQAKIDAAYKRGERRKATEEN